ncbi:hypothetical protein H257_18246 [Aphanomyces astaci]|uniref:Transposase Tc1-like domain-containing protein n=1 Tax=Aphanomyces astaci TaxID=112090 RepID=W4FBU2_APHAT|nr:hypothetical protein H257_18246 [Aphanomyces astaci]ETV64950.1 hypothetical protein H257_18246 [Aphanomyces astaci]|eukprot:XP_009845574.1 hypothetical protein H257_18246 [Aphanomyces astaci]
MSRPAETSATMNELLPTRFCWNDPSEVCFLMVHLSLLLSSLAAIGASWTRGRSSIADGAALANVDSRRKGNCGAKKVRSVIDIKMAIKAVPHEGRQTLCSTAVLSGMPKIAILRHMKEAHGLAARTSHLKPLLTDNMLERLWFAVSFVQPGLRRNHSFINMYKNVHVDEKWFFITKVKRRFYLYDDEEMTE